MFFISAFRKKPKTTACSDWDGSIKSYAKRNPIDDPIDLSNVRIKSKDGMQFHLLFCKKDNNNEFDF